MKSGKPFAAHNFQEDLAAWRCSGRNRAARGGGRGRRGRRGRAPPPAAEADDDDLVDEEEAKFAKYQPKHVAGKAHPDPVVENAAMAAVDPPPATHARACRAA